MSQPEPDIVAVQYEHNFSEAKEAVMDVHHLISHDQYDICLMVRENKPTSSEIKMKNICKMQIITTKRIQMCLLTAQASIAQSFISFVEVLRSNFPTPFISI